MQDPIDRQGQARTSTTLARGPGFALRRRVGRLAERAWRETLTRYMPEPWLVALKRGRFGLPVKPGHRPAANK